MDVITTTDPDKIAILIYDAQKIFNLAYKDKGGWFADSSPRRLAQKTKEIKYIKYGNVISAIATFEDRLGGLKCTGIAGNMELPKYIYKEAAKQLIKTIIDYDNCRYWIEASDAVEHYCKEFGGNPIPAAYVQNEMELTVSACDYDTYHYDRYIGKDKNLCTKCMYGFRDEETRDKVKEYLTAVSGIDYKTFKDSINENTRKIDKIVVKIDELNSDGIEELTNDMYTALVEGTQSENKHVSAIAWDLLKNMEKIVEYNLE